MKITSPDGLPLIKPASVHSTTDPAKPAEFEKMLYDATRQTQSKKSVTKSRRLLEPEPVRMPTHASKQTSFIDRTQQVIDLMDIYTQSLSDPSKTMRNIESALTNFLRKAQVVHKEYSNTGRPASELTKIMEDLLKTAQLEEIRFQNGNYVDLI